MTIAVGGNIGNAIEMRDALRETQDIMTNDLKFPTAVSAWNLDRPLRYDPTGTDTSGITGNLVKIKVSYPLADPLGNPLYLITDLQGNVIKTAGVPTFTVDDLTGNIWLGAINTGTVVGVVQFKARDAGILTEHKAQIGSLATAIDNLTSVISMFQSAENAMLNSGAIS